MKICAGRNEGSYAGASGSASICDRRYTRFECRHKLYTICEVVIVNIASIGGKIAVPHMLPYSAAKFALVGFSEGLHAELRSKGIRVTTVCPGLMRTGGEDHAKFVGDVAAEKRWFMFAATTPGVAVTADYAANRIYHATLQGRAEITISPQAFLAARFGGLFPETLQLANALTNHYILQNFTPWEPSTVSKQERGTHRSTWLRICKNGGLPSSHNLRYVAAQSFRPTDISRPQAITSKIRRFFL